MQTTHLLTTILLLFFMTNLSAQWEWENAEFSNLDLGYPLDGFLTLDNEEHDDYVIDMLVQPDGKTLIFGSSQNLLTSNKNYVLIRFDINGDLDNSFGRGGITTLPNEFYNKSHFSGAGSKFILQPDGKIVIIGGSAEHVFDDNDILILRYTSEGFLDDAFGDAGKVVLITETQERVYTIYQQPDEKLVLAGSASHFVAKDFFLLRCHSNGVIDTTFGEKGYVRTDFGKEDIPAKIIGQPDGKLLVLGKTVDSDLKKSDFALVRYLPDGTLDAIFGNEGKVITTIGVGKEANARSGLLQKDGKIILIGSAKAAYQSDYAMVRYHTDGRIDKSFGNKGKVLTNVSKYGDVGTSIANQPDGKILLAGNSKEWASHITLLRYDANGKLDYSFGDKGKQRPYFSIHGSGLKTMCIQDNKVILAGNLRLGTRPNYDFLIIRFLADFNVGTIDFSLNTNETLVYPNPIENRTTLEYTLNNNENMTIQLVDLQGRVLKIYLQNEAQQKGSYQQLIDLPTDLPRGMYFVRLTSPNGQVMIKVIK